MQKMFSQEIRFRPDNGGSFEEWEEKRLGDVLSVPKKEKLISFDPDRILTVKLKLKGISKSKNTE